MIYRPHILIFGLFLAFSFQMACGQSSLGLRGSNFYVGYNDISQLEGASTVLSGSSYSSSDYRFRRFAVGGFYEFSPKSTFYKRVVFQFAEDFANDGKTWNLAQGERAILSLRRSSPSFTGAFSTGRFWQIKRLRFAFGIEAGLTYSRGAKQMELYSFFDSLEILRGMTSFNTSQPAIYQPYAKWFGSGYYRFSKRFALGIELAYGLEGYYSKGTKSVTRIDRDPAGNTLNMSMENTDVKFFYVNLPARLTLPYIGITYLFGQKSDEQGVDREVVNR